MIEKNTVACFFHVLKDGKFYRTSDLEMASSITFRLTIRKENVDKNVERREKKVENEKRSRTKVTLKEKRLIIDDYREGKV